MKLTIQNKIYLSIAGFILLIILMIVFAIYPLFKDMKNNSQELISQKEKFAVLGTKISNLENFKIIYKELEETLDKIDDLFTNPEVPVGFISFLEKSAKESQIEIEISSSPSPKSKKDFWPSLNFQITSTGSFTNFLKFLEKIENSQYLVEIENLNVNRIRGSLGSVTTNLSIKVFTK